MSLTVTEIRATDKSAYIGRCTEMLPNQMQCYRGADYVYTNDVTEAGKEPRQVCRYHAKYLIELERQRLQDEQNKSANPEPPKDETVKSAEPSEIKPEPPKTENNVNVNPTTSSATDKK